MIERLLGRLRMSIGRTADARALAQRHLASLRRALPLLPGSDPVIAARVAEMERFVRGDGR